MATISPLHLNDGTTNKNVRQLVWHLYYVYTAVEGSELYCYNTEGDRNSVVSQALCRTGWKLLESQAYGSSIRF